MNRIFATTQNKVQAAKVVDRLKTEGFSNDEILVLRDGEEADLAIAEMGLTRAAAGFDSSSTLVCVDAYNESEEHSAREIFEQEGLTPLESPVIEASTEADDAVGLASGPTTATSGPYAGTEPIIPRSPADAPTHRRHRRH